MATVPRVTTGSTPNDIPMTTRGAEWTIDPERRVAIIGGVVVGFAFVGIGALLGERLHLRGLWLPLFALGVGGGVGWSVQRFARAVATGAGRGIAAFLYPSGDSAPYEMTFSAHDALEARDDSVGAMAAYEATIAQRPTNVRAKRQAAELHARVGHPIRAAELLADIRRLPGVRPADELYATQRLIDLYLGPLGDAGRAMVELRRVADRFAGTPEAAGARRAIERLKAEARDRDVAG